jgi:N-acetylmuramic acid 6-phosphate etherase
MERSTTEVATAGIAGIDTWPDTQVLEALVAGQERAIAAARAAIPGIAAAAAAIAPRLHAGGSLIYAGAGTSIRIAVQDGAELPATFGMPESRIAYLIAGGRQAMFDTLAEAEDDAADGARAAAICRPGDVLVAVSASGTTPYTLAAAAWAQAAGTLVIALVNNGATPLGAMADIAIVLDSGPEIIAGSTRMGAGTAQKAALNLLSTLTHIKLGAVHDGMMVNVQAGNLKLRRRARDIVMAIAHVDEARAAEALDLAGGAVKPAVLICAGVGAPEAAERLMAEATGNLRLALAKLSAA